jgi:hypothetical protein
MTPRRTLILVALGVVALLLGWQFGTGSGERSSTAPGTLVFPGLAAKLQTAARVEVMHANKTLVIARHGDIWGLADRGGYPVQQDKLRELLTGLTELRITEARTALPSEYALLGVDDPKLITSTANLLRVLDADGKPIAELIVGHRRVRTQGNVPESIFIRRPGEAQSWLAEGRLPVDADPQLWLDRDIADIPKEKIAKVTTTRIATGGDVTMEFVHDGDKFTLATPADHPKLDQYHVEDVFGALDGLTLTDVKPGAEMPGTKLGTSVLTTTDGMTVTATLYKAGKDIWASFAVAGSGKAEAEAKKLAARVTGWAYQVGSWKEQAFLPTLDDLKASEPAKPAAKTP